MEVFNTIGQPVKLQEFLRLDLIRFKFKGIHRGKAIFEFVLIHRDYDVDLFEELRQYGIRTHVNQLIKNKDSQGFIQKKMAEFCINAINTVWYLFHSF